MRDSHIRVYDDAIFPADLNSPLFRSCEQCKKWGEEGQWIGWGQTRCYGCASGGTADTDAPSFDTPGDVVNHLMEQAK